MARSSLSYSVQLDDRWTLHIDNQFPLNVALTIQVTTFLILEEDYSLIVSVLAASQDSYRRLGSALL